MKRLDPSFTDPLPPPPGTQALAGRKVLVTGATGFLGSRLVEALADAGADVTAVARNPARAGRIARKGVRILQADLLRRREVEAAARGQEVVFSLAHDLLRSGASNFRAYAALVEAAAGGGVRRFVHASSIAAYDDWPVGDLTEASPRDRAGYEYKDVKRAIERDLGERAARGSFSAAILQPTIVYGPYSKLWTDLIARRMAAGDVVLPDEGQGLCNGVFVDDVVQALARAGAADIPGAEAYIVSGAEPFRWRDLFEGYAAVLPGRVMLEPAGGPPAPPPQAPSLAHSFASAAFGAARRAPLRDLVGFLQARVGEERLSGLRDRLQRGDGPYRPADAQPELYRAQGVCSIAKARADLGYEPCFSLSQGLAITQAYIARRYGGAGN